MAQFDRIQLDDIGEDHYRPRGHGLRVRALNRVMTPVYRRELASEILLRCRALKPDAVVVYKGNLVSAATITAIRRMGIATINVFPDYSPHAFGLTLRRAMGAYDLVVSTKPFHPAHWNSTYGYGNRCVCVPHGYDPDVHYWADAPRIQDIDVVLAASWRPQYEDVMTELGRLISEQGVSVALAGTGWSARRAKFPAHWQFPGALFGRAYGEFVRRGKIVIAPVHTEVEIDGKRQPGDEDTTRTYELAAAGTFFLHRRTHYVQTVYEEGVEVDFWDDASELAGKIRRYLPLEEQRRAIASAAHQRAVPVYSVTARAKQIVEHIEALIANGCKACGDA